VKEISGSPSEIRFEPLPTDDPVRRRPDISRARSVLGWEPKVPLRDGLKGTLDYFDDFLRTSGVVNRKQPFPERVALV
jgi:nucleoside-diphosphate-sugar epimerase